MASSTSLAPNGVKGFCNPAQPRRMAVFSIPNGRFRLRKCGALPADERDTGAACAKAPRMKSIYQLISIGVNGPFARTIALLAVAVLMTATAAHVFAHDKDRYTRGAWHYK